jgi:FlaG/FlaF family flagellin (archaellin)
MSRRRAISPIVGIPLMVAVVVGLAAVSGVLLFDLAGQQDPAPAAKFEVEADDDGVTHWVRLAQGPNLDGDRLSLLNADDPDVFAGREVGAGDEDEFLPASMDVAVVWEGDDGTAHTLGTFEVDWSLPDADHGCPWVDSETNGGSDKLDVDGDVVDCDAATAKDVEVTTSGVIVGDTDSGQVVDADDATFYGDVAADDLVSQLDSEVYGDVAADDLAKVDAGSVDGSVTAADEAELVSGSTVDGDVAADDLAKVDGSTVNGSVVSDGSHPDVKLVDANIRGHVYVDDADFDCTGSTIRGQDCSEYTPKDPDDY